MSATSAIPRWPTAAAAAYAASAGLRSAAVPPTVVSPMTVPPYLADLQSTRAAVAGDSGARAEIGRRLTVVEPMCQARNRRAGRPLTGDDVADLAQEVRLKTWERLADYAGNAPFEAWVFGFVEFFMRNAVRKQRRRPQPQALDDDTTPGLGIPTPVFHDDVYRCLERLGALDQQIVRAKFFDGLTLEEIGVRLAMNLNTLKSRYVRALQQMHGCLAAGSQEHP